MGGEKLGSNLVWIKENFNLITFHELLINSLPATSSNNGNYEMRIKAESSIAQSDKYTYSQTPRESREGSRRWDTAWPCGSTHAITCASSSGEGYTCASRRETLVVSYNLSVLLKASGFPSFLLPLQSDFFLCPDPSRRRRRHKYRSVSLFLTLSPSSRKFFLSRSLVVGAIHSQVLILYCTRASENKTTSRATTGLSVHWPPTICTIGFCNVKSSIRFCTLH